MIKIKNLWASFADKEILRGVNLAISAGETHVIMGKNGSGKSTLLKTIAGHPDYQVTKGEELLDGENILSLAANQRAEKGVFLAFQIVPELEGISLLYFLQSIWRAKIMNETGKDLRTLRKDKEWRIQLSPNVFRRRVTEMIKHYDLPEDTINRDMASSFSGGEKKKIELIQMELLEPRLAMFDEIDSGVDTGSLDYILSKIEELKKKTGMTSIFVTHNPSFLEKIKFDKLHVFKNGQIEKTTANLK